MKILKSGLFILLILKASFGFGMLPSLVSSDCCAADDAIEIVDNQDSEDNGCCDGAPCSCICCGHVFVGSTVKVIQGVNPPIIDTNPTFIYDGYKILMASSIWQPPRIIQ
ncbi:MAG: hypothetical protein HKN09_09730 [Saprospiraceae bacterium]|nr:hypothetical protein [Saprospiraceae bacterium]